MSVTTQSASTHVSGSRSCQSIFSLFSSNESKIDSLHLLFPVYLQNVRKLCASGDWDLRRLENRVHKAKDLLVGINPGELIVTDQTHRANLLIIWYERTLNFIIHLKTGLSDEEKLALASKFSSELDGMVWFSDADNQRDYLALGRVIGFLMTRNKAAAAATKERIFTRDPKCKAIELIHSCSGLR